MPKRYGTWNYTTPVKFRRVIKDKSPSISPSRLSELLSSGASTLGRKSYSSTATQTMNKFGYQRKLHSLGTGPVRKGKRKRVKAIDKKPKVGKKMRKFIKKVKRVMDYNEVIGKCTIYETAQLYQTTRDKWATLNTNERGYEFAYGGNNDLLNYASMLFAGKTLTANYNTTAGNLDENIKLNLNYYYVKFDFKSTSSHVNVVEMYVCRAKENLGTGEAVQDKINDSYTGINFKFQDYSGSGTTTGQLVMGSTSNEWTQLMKTYNVTKRTIVFQPGGEASEFVKIFGNTTLDLSHRRDGTSTYPYPKGSVAVYFRIVNKATVSGTLTNRVHNWESTTVGGVAIAIRKVCVIRPPANTTEANMKNSIVTLNDTNIKTTETDQQVTIMNPIDKTTFAG